MVKGSEILQPHDPWLQPKNPAVDLKNSGEQPLPAVALKSQFLVVEKLASALGAYSTRQLSSMVSHVQSGKNFLHTSHLHDAQTRGSRKVLYLLWSCQMYFYYCPMEGRVLI